MKKLTEPKTIGVRLDKKDLETLKAIDPKPSKALRILLERHRNDSQPQR